MKKSETIILDLSNNKETAALRRLRKLMRRERKELLKELS
jgi:hypothetical protein